MRVRRTAALAGLVLGLSLAAPSAWADEPTSDPTCTAGPVDDGGGADGGGGGEVTPEPAPSGGAVTEEPLPIDEPTSDEGIPDPAETPEPEGTVEPAEPAEPTEPAAPAEPVEPTPDVTDVAAEPGASSAPEACVFLTAAESAGQDTGLAPQAAERASGAGATQLPRTGEPSRDLLALGLGLVLIGAATVAAAGRRTA